MLPLKMRQTPILERRVLADASVAENVLSIVIITKHG
jgi:hypothetical protein